MRKGLFQKIMAVALAATMIFSTAIPAAAEISAQANEETEVDTYLPNQGELAVSELMQLPVGAVNPEGWLENQMLLMKEGITGLMKDHKNYNYSSSAWLNGTSGEAWEKGPYFARGITAMAYVLDDDELLDEAMDWVTAIIDSQTDTGFFGPSSNTDWWARMPALNVIRDFYEGAEAKDPSERTAEEQEYMDKVIPFFEAYFRYELENLPGRALDSSWGQKRAADNIEIVYWLYNHQYDAAAPEDTDWLMDLVDVIWGQATKWDQEAQTTTIRHHVVNTTQGLKFSPILSLYDQDSESLREGFAKTLDNIGLDHGRIDGLANADESARDNQSIRGTELCSVAEGIVSAGIALEVYDEAWIGDWLETLAYNSLPAEYPDNYSGQSYFVQQNQPITTLGIHEFTQDYGNGTAYGAPGGFECCFPNNHMAWAKFVQNMWMATNTGGLALTTYGPNHVTAKVADGKIAVFKETTDYPFKNTVQLDYLGDTAEFDLRLRVPEWAKGVTITVNGVSQNDIVAGEFYKIVREWTKGDKVSITFTAEVELSTWYNNSTAVQYGALIYTLQIEEDWRTYDSSDISGVTPTEEQPQWEVYPASAWNYGLVTDENAVFEVVEGDVGLHPFTGADAPIKIKAKGVLIDEWTLDGNNAGVQPYGPIRYSEDEVEDITLIPYGCPNIRITHMPTMNNTAPVNKVVREESNIIKRSGVTYQDFDNVVVPSADNYNLKITAEGTGTMIINSNYEQEITGDTVVENLKDLEGLSGYFQFKEGQYNNIRFTGDIQVSKIEVEIMDKKIEDIRIIVGKREEKSVKITTNLNVLETPYEVVYGTESGVYTNSVTGFDSGTATIYDLNPDTTYYMVVKAIINGERMTSSEYVLAPYTASDELTLNANAIAAEYTGFESVEDVRANWNMIDPDAVISAQGVGGSAQIQVGKSTDVKAVLEVENSAYWTDYATEVDIAITEEPTNNAGFMFRTTDASAGPDGYKGYYMGIGKGGVMIGLANGSGWTQIEQISYTVNVGQTYTLKAVAYDNMIAYYVDGNLVKVWEDDRYVCGTVGVRSYNVPFAVSGVRVSSLTDADLDVFREYLASQVVEEEPIVVRPEYNKASYEGLGTTAEETAADFTLYDPSNLIAVNEDGTIYMGKGSQVKAVYNAENPDEWVDYAVEGKFILDANGSNNCGIMYRVDPASVGNGSDEYKGYFAGIGGLNSSTNRGIMIGYANGSRWTQQHTIPCEINAGQEYTLKVVVYDYNVAIYLDGQLMYQFTDADEKFASGTVGVRSWNEAFTVTDLDVRGLTADDLEVFGGEPTLNEDFENGNTGAWTLIGDTSKINFQNGQIEFGSSSNVKAVAGNTNWTDYVVSADIHPGAGSTINNAGIMLRVTNPRSGADGYEGYFFGINATSYCFGKANGNWLFLENPSRDIGSGVHNLKVVASGSTFLCYIDDELITIIEDSTYANGQIGMRSYNCAFTADNVEVRGMNKEEAADLKDYQEQGKKITISAVSSDGTIQLKYPGVTASKVRIVYGTESGVYTNAYEDLPCRTGTNKVALSVPNGTYFVKMYMMSGNTIIAQSNEIEVTTGYEEDVTVAKDKMLAKLDEADNCDTTAFTAVSQKRLDDSISYAQAVWAKEDPNQMEFAVARALLNVSINNPSTEYPEVSEVPVSLPFEDVAEDAWYYDAVYYNFCKKLMTGKSEKIFAPEVSLTRAEFAAVLYTANGQPDVTYEDAFSDVSEGDWFAKAVFWAKQQGIVNGYGDGSFGPNDPVAREQIAIMMYNYAAAKGYKTDQSADLSSFADAGDVSEYAEKAMQWAVGARVIIGKDDGTRLDPYGAASRAECAAIMQRFMTNCVK